tara:strand:- start:4709 stop:5824 length:1116 start_codon:yes stop_codon:yes gene_type:complete
MDVNDEWDQFLEGDGEQIQSNNSDKADIENNNVCEDLYISTKTKVLYLNQDINIQELFWHIPIVDYSVPKNGIIKKQMKLVFTNEDDYNSYKERLKSIPYYVENELKHINNPEARRIKFKDERKITVGLSKKDLLNCRSKVKNAFYNCFALIARFEYKNSFNEIHIKVFNTGKLEIPGILDNSFIDTVKHIIIETLQPFIDKPLEFVNTNKEQNVLINSNFNCGFYIDREKLNSILTNKYNIETSYDPCSYPGVKCKYYFNNNSSATIQNGKISDEDRNLKMSELDNNKKYTEVSFMVFRTGSCLIVGNCTETILETVYTFIKTILLDEYKNIYIETEEPTEKIKRKKTRKKTIQVTNDYYQEKILNKKSS